MICWMREAVVKQGHMAEGRTFARDIVAHDNNEGAGTFKVFHARYGQLNRLLWTAEFADLAALEAWQTRARDDEQAQALLARGIPLFADGSIHDSVTEVSMTASSRRSSSNARPIKRSRTKVLGHSLLLYADSCV